MFVQPTKKHRKCLVSAATVITLMGLFVATTAKVANASDILWYNRSTGESQIWVMDGNRVNKTATVVGETGKVAYVGPPFSIVAAGDFSGDHKDDIVWYNSSTGETQFWVMNDFQVSSRATVLGPDGKPTYIGPPFSIVGAGDFFGDQ